MEQLTLEQAAIDYHYGGHIDRITDLEYNAFKAGAEWQKQQYNKLHILAARASQELDLLGPSELANELIKELNKLIP